MVLHVKFSHTRYRVLGPELIPMYEQSARMSYPGGIYIGCRNFPLGLWSPSHPKNVTILRPVPTKLYCLVTEVYKCEQLVQGCSDGQITNQIRSRCQPNDNSSIECAKCHQCISGLTVNVSAKIRDGNITEINSLTQLQ